MSDQIIAAILVAAGTIIGSLITAKVIGLRWTRKDKVPGVLLSSEGTESRFYEKRGDLPSRTSSLERASDELCMMCIHATGFIQENEALLKSKLKKCKVKILMMALEVDGVRNPNIAEFERTTRHPAVGPHIQSAIKLLKQLASELDTTQKSNLEVRAYNIYPSCMYLLVDPDGSSGFVICESMPPYTEIDNRPAFKMATIEMPGMVKTIYNSFSNIWSESKVIDLVLDG